VSASRNLSRARVRAGGGALGAVATGLDAAAENGGVRGPVLFRRVGLDSLAGRESVQLSFSRLGAFSALAPVRIQAGAVCWIPWTRKASTMSLTPRMIAKAATQATSSVALRP
jgi:hypothetical protein